MRTGPHFWNAPCSECAGHGRNPGGFLFPVKNIHGTRREGGQHRFRIAESPCRDSQRAVPACHSNGRRSGISLRNQMVQHVFPAFRFNDVKKSRCRSSQRRNRPALALRAVLLKNRGIFMERTRRSSKSEPGLPCVPQVHGARFRQAA